VAAAAAWAAAWAAWAAGWTTRNEWIQGPRSKVERGWSGGFPGQPFWVRGRRAKVDAASRHDAPSPRRLRAAPLSHCGGRGEGEHSQTRIGETDHRVPQTLVGLRPPLPFRGRGVARRSDAGGAGVGRRRAVRIQARATTPPYPVGAYRPRPYDRPAPRSMPPKRRADSTSSSGGYSPNASRSMFAPLPSR